MTRPSARALLGAVSALAAVLVAGAAAAQAVPTDPLVNNTSGCPLITQPVVANMFQTHTVTLNGVVTAADSTQFLAPNCGFFQWSEQMFLWMTSPAPASYGGGSRIMFSPKFYTVTPEGSDGRRSFIANNPRLPLQMALRKTELGPHGLPALMTRTGQVVEVQKTEKPVPPIVRLPTGTLVTLSAARRAPNGALRLFDTKGAEIQASRLALPMIVRPKIMIAPGKFVPVVPAHAIQTSIVARKFILNKIPIFIDSAGNIIDVEPGQADGGVLLSQNGSLIYYITVVNDLYAFDRTMKGPAVINAPTSINFPTTAAQGAAVAAFALTKGHTILEPQALAVESKSSWIEASSVPNPGDYIQAEAVVPVFNTSNPDSWTPTGATKTVKVVMVGIHVVGSTLGHGEMVWGTFEHLGNAPNASYTYASTTGSKTLGLLPGQAVTGSWTFTPTGSTGPFNGPATGPSTSWSGTAIVGTPVSSTPVLRAKPWGVDGTNSFLNTQVISANAAVIKALKPGDVRANYFQLGTTWTAGGAVPSPGTEVGSNQLANATIETFMQSSVPGSNCFLCHQSNNVSVSHIYGVLKPLP